MEPKPKPGSEIVLFQTEDGRTRLEVRLDNETVWLTQSQMAELFQTTRQNVGQHIQNLFAEGELREVSVVKESFTTAAHGKNYQTRFFNLDVIISVGYRVKSLRGTPFRIWATQRLRDANAGKPNMGLKTWSGRTVRKHDIHVAKNYLNAEETNCAPWTWFEPSRGKHE